MKLLEQFGAACRTMNFAPATCNVYGYWVEDFLRFHFRRSGHWIHPRELRETGVEQFLTHLACDRNLSASAQSQAMRALVLLYRVVLKDPLGEIAAVRAKRPQRPQRLPTVLSQDEVRRVLTALARHPVYGLMGRLLYGGGLRVRGKVVRLILLRLPVYSDQINLTLVCGFYQKKTTPDVFVRMG